MGALSEVYVDPAINAASGAGTIGDPYGDLQHGLTSLTFDNTNGTRVNVKAGTSEILTGALTLPAGAGGGDPLIIEGYTSAAGDGGLGVIDGNAGAYAFATTINWSHWRNIRFTNSTAATALTLGITKTITDCEFDNLTGNALSATNSPVVKCYFHDISGVGVTGTHIADCFFSTGTKSMSAGVFAASAATVLRCIFNVAGSTNGIDAVPYGVYLNNSILSAGGTGDGAKATGHSEQNFFNNVIEGFSGSGGKGFNWAASDIITGRNNAAYNNATNYNITDDHGSDNETLGASPFAKTGAIPTDFTSADFWTDLYTYFTPVDTGNMSSGLGGNVYKGAVQPAAGGGSSFAADTIKGDSLMPIFRNVAGQKLPVYAWDDTTAAGTDPAKTGDAANITAQISIDGGAAAATNDTNPTETDATDHPGGYVFDLTQAETNGLMLQVTPVSSTANVLLAPVVIYTTPIETAYSGPRGPGIYYDSGASNTNTQPGTDGTPTNPVSTLAAAKTLADSFFKRIYIVGGSTATLAATMDEYEFVGISGGSLARNKVALASQSCASANFYNLQITGIQTAGTQAADAWDCVIGTSSLQMDLHRCQLSAGTTITLLAGKQTIWDSCFSGVAGASTPNVTFAGASEQLSMRHYSGGVTIKSMTATEELSLEGNGQVIWDASCTGGSPAVRGTFKETDNSGGNVTPVYGGVNVNKISGDSTAADNLELDYDGTGYAKDNSTIGTCTVNTDMVGLTTGVEYVFTQQSANAGAKSSNTTITEA